MPEQCTKLSLIARSALFAKFQENLSGEEEEQARTAFDQYLFYAQHPKGGRIYLCTNCCNTWTTSKSEPKANCCQHNNLGYCPQCHARVTYKAVGRLGRNGAYPSLHEEHNLVLFRAAEDGGLKISAGRIVADYQPGEFDGWYDEDAPIFPVPTLEFWERRRYYLAPDLVLSWKREFGVCKGPWGMPTRWESEWKSCAAAGEPNPVDSIMTRQPDGGAYRVIGWEALGETKLRYSAVEQYFSLERSLFRGVVTYLARYAKRPQLELLVKLGHTELIDQLLDFGRLNGRLVNWRAKSPHAFFRLSKPAYRLWTESGGALALLPLMQALPAGMPEEERKRILRAKSMGPELLAKLVRTADNRGVPVHRLLGYLKSQQRAQLWLDYLNMGDKLKLDFSREDVLLPKDLRARHDNAMEQLQVEADRAMMKKYRTRKKSLYRQYAMEAAGYCIRVPESAEEIRAEGVALQHCVGGYAARHMEGKVTILFLRSLNQPDKPLCTIEMNGKNLVQIHGYKNDLGQQSPRKIYGEFLDLWLPWVEQGSPRDKQGRPVLPGRQKEAIIA